MTETSSKSARTRDIVLMLASFAVSIAAVKYRMPWLAWVGIAMFWLAVLDSTRQQPGRTRLIARLAAAILLTLTALLILVGILTFRHAVTRRTMPQIAPLSAPELPLPPPPPVPSR